MTKPSELTRQLMPDYDAMADPTGRVYIANPAMMARITAVAQLEAERKKLKWNKWITQLEAAERQHPELFSADANHEERRRHRPDATNKLPEYPEIWRQVFPDLDEVYKPGLSMNLNIALLIKRTEDSHKRQVKEVLHALRQPVSDTQESPLQALQQQATNMFMHGPLLAGGIFASLSAAAEFCETKVKTPNDDMPIPWNSCKAAATLVGLLACPQDRLFEVLKFQSQRLGGLPTLDMIRSTPTSSLQTAFRNAKGLARGDKAISSVIVVSLIDVHIFELAREGRSQPYTSYAHTFVLGIGPEGVAIWQGWGEHGYGLDQWISDGGSRTRTWQEAGDLVDVFEKFAAYKGRWDAKRNKLYKKCFDVDIIQICGAKGPSRPIVPKVESWVRLLVMEDVKLGDVYKFTFE